MNQTGQFDQRRRPRDGDVLLAQKADGVVGFTVSVVPGPEQVAFVSYRKALMVARAFAQRSHAVLWIQRNGGKPHVVRESRQRETVLR